MLGVAIVVLIICIFISLFFLIFSDSIAKKLQAAGVIINLIILLMLTIGFFFGRPEFVDIVLVFLLLNLVGLIGFYRLLNNGTVGVTSKELNVGRINRD